MNCSCEVNRESVGFKCRLPIQRNQRGLNAKRSTIVFFWLQQNLSPNIWIGKPHASDTVLVKSRDMIAVVRRGKDDRKQNTLASLTEKYFFLDESRFKCRRYFRRNINFLE